MSLEQDIVALRATPLLGQLDPEALRLIAFSGDKREARAGDELIRAGALLSGGMVILEGSVILAPGGEFGGHAQIAGAGELLAEVALVVDMNAPYSVTAREPSTVLFVPRRLFKRVLTELPANAALIRAAFAARLQGMKQDMTRVAQKLEELDQLASRARKASAEAGDRAAG